MGRLVAEFMEGGIIVLFGSDAPDELTEFSILHSGKDLIHPVKSGDRLCIGEETYTILAVGEVANTNLANLGHLILKFNGRTEPELPGDICVEMKPLPPIKIGTEITISGPTC
jgi:PTS system glucitol/sorbitol-specific IIA component